MKLSVRKTARIIRHKRIRSRVRGSEARPRLSVYRSSRGLFLQLIDDDIARTLIGISDKALSGKKKLTKSDRAFALGKLIAEKARELGITTAVFDRGGYRYHGRVARIADGAREGGLQF